MKSSWMILLGSILLLAGLANSVYGVRQTASPFDVVGGEPFEALTDTQNNQAVEAVQLGDDLLAPVSVESPNGSKQLDMLFDESAEPTGLIPDRLVIESIGLDASVIPTKIKEIEYQGQPYYQWLAPNEPAVGWHEASALLGSPGNTVLNGHHNIYGEVFKDLANVHEGDLIEVYSGNNIFRYRVALAMLLPERFKSLSIRLENARWIYPTDDERITLITCWPYQSNTHRVIIVALPVD